MWYFDWFQAYMSWVMLLQGWNNTVNHAVLDKRRLYELMLYLSFVLPCQTANSEDAQPRLVPTNAYRCTPSTAQWQRICWVCQAGDVWLCREQANPADAACRVWWIWHQHRFQAGTNFTYFFNKLVILNFLGKPLATIWIRDYHFVWLDYRAI